MNPKVAVPNISSLVDPFRLTDFAPEMELWEPPFERWMRLADSCLRNAAAQDDKGNSPAAALRKSHANQIN
jgi:hypothetical protein